MNRPVPKSTQNNKTNLLSLLFILASVGSIIAGFVLVNLPSESGAIFGLSPVRLALLASIALPGIACLFTAFSNISKKLFNKANSMPSQKAALLIVLTITTAILCITAVFLLKDLYTGTGTYYYFAYAQRLEPVLFYFAFLLLLAAVFFTYLTRGKIKSLLVSEKPFLVPWGLTFAGLLFLVVLISISRLGLTPDPIGWGAPTVPMMEWQLWLGVIICLFYRILMTRPFVKNITGWSDAHPKISGWLITLVIWSLAMLLWATQPIPRGFFATPPRAPNFEVYPFSDAAFYDFHAQSLLIGEGFRGESIPPRPLYILFLAASHWLIGQDYSRIVLVQTALLALFPVVAYWITRKLSNQTVAFVASIFIILREWTSIVFTPFTSDISNSKLLFADLPAAFVISLVLLVALHWLQHPRNITFSLLTGGILGISLLIRTQIIILLPVILVFYWFISLRERIPWRRWIFPSLLCLAGFILAVAPWLSRSYRITGQFVFDHPESQTRVMAQRYYPEIDQADFDRKSDETTGEYNRRLSAAIRSQIFGHPDQVIKFVTAHWLNSEIANLQIFPVRFSITGVQELIQPEHAFWEEWNGHANPRHLLIFLLNLAILGAGVVYLTRKNPWLGLLPLIFNLTYHFSNAAARNSGWRYLLPADWIFLLYFAAGLFALIMLGKTTMGKNPPPTRRGENPVSLFKLAGIAAGVFCIGFLPLYAENAFPRVYPTAAVDNTGPIFEKGISNLSTEYHDNLKSLLNDPNVIIMQGRMFYPRFYEANEGEEKTGKTGYTPLDYARYVFLVAGDPEGTVIFPHTQQDLPLKNAGDVILVGCMDGLAVKARLVILPGEDISAFTADPSLSWTCSEKQ